MGTLTAKQQRIYDFIQAFTAQHGYPPSVREIGAAVGLKSPSTVHFHLKGLEEAGMIIKAEGKTGPLPWLPPEAGAYRRKQIPTPTRFRFWATWPPAPPSWRKSALRTI